MLKLSEDVDLRDDGLNGCHLEPTMHRYNSALSSVKLCDSKSDGTEELRMQWCISTAEIHKHTVVEVPQRITSRAVTACTWLMIGGRHKLEWVYPPRMFPE